jgi:cytochrome c2
VLAGLAVAGACAGKDKGGSPPGGGGAVVQPAVTSQDPRAALFLQKGCPQCHSISALGVKSPTEVGPDLTLAYDDVKNRFNQSLEEFLRNPTGTMQIVLSQMITLSPEERDSVIHILKRLHEEREERGEH